MGIKEVNNGNDDCNPQFSVVPARFAKQDRKRRACDDKTPYDTALDAYRAAQWRNRECPVRYSDMGHYDCHYCAKWHIGHKDNRALWLLKRARYNKAREDICRTLPMAARLTLQSTQQAR